MKRILSYVDSALQLVGLVLIVAAVYLLLGTPWTLAAAGIALLALSLALG